MTIIEQINEMASGGWSENYIIEALQLRGYSLSSIEEALITEEDGTVTSGDFGSALPADQGHKWKRDGADLNKQARDSLESMGITLYSKGGSLDENLLIKIGKNFYKLA